MAHYKKFRLSTLAAVVGIVLAVGPENSYAEAPIQFNTRFLDVKDDASLDLSRFSRKGYIMPGSYHLQVLVNQSQIAQDNVITYSVDNNDPDNTYPCLSPELVSLLGLKPEIADKMIWINAGQCLQPDQLEGMETQTDLSQSTLTVIIPQAYLEYSDEEWIDLPAGMKGFPAYYLTTTLTASGDMLNMMTAMSMTSAATARWVPTSARGVCARTGRLTIVTKMTAKIKTTLAPVPNRTGTGTAITPGGRSHSSGRS